MKPLVWSQTPKSIDALRIFGISTKRQKRVGELSLYSVILLLLKKASIYMTS